MPAEMAVLEGLPNKLCSYEKSSSALWILLKIIPTVILKNYLKNQNTGIHIILLRVA